MSLKVQDFRAQLVGDGARPSLFKCSLTFPFLAGGAQQKFTFMCRASQLPGSTVNQIPVYYLGRELKFSGNRTFSEWTCTIINDEDFIIRRAFEFWLNGLNSHGGNLRAPDFIKGDGGYQQNGYITQLGKADEILKVYKMVGAFPIDLSPIEVDYGATDQIEEYNVTLAYQWWSSDTTDDIDSSDELSPIFSRGD